METRHIRVLLIEDNPADVELIKHQLSKTEKSRHELLHVDRLEKGLKYLDKNEIDVVLLDLNLPDGTGLDTFERANAHAPHMPIIVLTGHDDDELGIEAVQKGAQDYLVKGSAVNALLGRSIRYAIERKKMLTQLEQSMKEIKTLKGFLPICAGCKKIRDDKGYWTQIEAYISSQTDTEFSHGICPDCAKTFYKDYLDKKA